MQELPPGEAQEPARRPDPHVLPRLRLSSQRLSLPATLGLSALSGLLLSLANPPADVGPLAFVAMVPFLWAVREARPRRGLLAGFAFGIPYFAATIYWILLFGTLAWGSLSVASAAYPALFGLLAPVVWRRERPLRSAVGVAALWTVTEYFRSLWPVGGFTWGGVAYTQAGNGFLLPLASWTGAWGVSFVVVLVNALVLEAVDRAVRSLGPGRAVRSLGSGGRSRRAAAVLAPAGLALAVVLLPGLIRIPAPNGRRLDIAVVQGNQFDVGGPQTLHKEILVTTNTARLDRTLAGERPRPALVVWPEDSVDQDPSLYQPFHDLVLGAIRKVGVPTLVGGITRGLGGKQFNTTTLYDGRGRIVGRYTKIHLVPFGEYVPWRRELDWISAIHQVPRDLTPGHRLNVLRVQGIPFASVICFENSFPSLDRRLVALGGQFVVVATNNASYRHTAAARQHLIMSRFRAVENGRWVVHAAVSGISAFIDPNGGLHAATGLFQGTIDRFTIQASTARTVYTRLGDYLPWACFGLVVLLMVAPRRRRRPKEVATALLDDVRALVVLPTYNERASVEEVITRVLRADGRVDVLVVDDGSPDGTGDVVRAFAEREPRVRLVERAGKGGLASAYLEGFRRGLEEGYPLVVEIDADLSHQPEELPRLLEGARRFDLTIGSRYVPGGSITNWGTLRRVLSRGGNLYTRLALGIPLSDATSGYRVFRRDLLRSLVARGIHSDGYAFQIELAYRAWREGWAVGEVPISFRDREHGHSKISRRIVIEALGLVAVWGLRDRLRVPFRDDDALRDGDRPVVEESRTAPDMAEPPVAPSSRP